MASCRCSNAVGGTAGAGKAAMGSCFELNVTALNTRIATKTATNARINKKLRFTIILPKI
jgi:hypothetical protein